MDKRFIGLGAAVIVVGIAGAWYFYSGRESAEAPPAVALPAPEPASGLTDEPEIANPVPEEATLESEALPSLAQSDPVVVQSLSSAVGAEPIERFLVTDDVVRRIVATVDNLPRKKVAVRLRPVQPTPGRFVTEGSEDENNVTLGAANAERYAPLIKIVQSADSEQIAQLYFRYYPLFQQAYEDLGYPSGYFNDRLIEVIDHLLETPEVQGPIKLVQPRVFYEFADPELEALSSGQKLLIRMGPQNAAAVKAKLRELRAHVAAQGQSPDATRAPAAQTP